MTEGLRNFNKVILVGRLTHSPELKYTAKGIPLTRFNLAVNTKNNKVDETLFIDVVTWNKTAEFCAQYFKKGKGVCVEGYLSMRKWKVNNDEVKTKIEVVADKLSFLENISGDKVTEISDNENRDLSDIKKTFSSENIKNDDIPF